MNRLTSALVVLGMFAAGCAGTGQAECRSANWYDVGFRDAIFGMQPQAEVYVQQCETQGGSIVGDIGDGSTGRADYVCPSGKPPLGNIAPPAEGPVAVEGSVCCPQ